MSRAPYPLGSVSLALRCLALALNGALLGGAAFAGVLLAPRAWEAGTPLREPGNLTDTSGGGWATYCGVYAVCRAARALGIECHFEQLLDARYIGTKRGSTLEDLARAARDLGLEARPLAGMNGAALRQLTSPAVLHVKASAASAVYDHWTLFMGLEGEEAILYDGPLETPRRVPLPRLLALWDGTMLLLDASRVPPVHAIRFAAVAQYLFFGCLFLAAILAVAHLAPAGGTARVHLPLGRALAQSAWQAVLLLAFALAAAGASTLGAGLGPLAAPQTTRELTNANVAQLLPRLGPADVARLMAEPGVRFVDPRSQSEFKSDHLPHAIHLPWPDVLARGALAARLKELPPAQLWVVYENVTPCRAESLAAALWQAGSLRP